MLYSGLQKVITATVMVAKLYTLQLLDMKNEQLNMIGQIMLLKFRVNKNPL